MKSYVVVFSAKPAVRLSHAITKMELNVFIIFSPFTWTAVLRQRERVAGICPPAPVNIRDSCH